MAMKSMVRQIQLRSEKRLLFFSFSVFFLSG